MRILLSNDDGYFAPGLGALARALAPLADITVVAPERDRSGASNSLTLDRPLMLRQEPGGFYYVNGTPTDCVHLAVTGMLDHLPDIVISGINHGANMGDDTIYSGTVAAATEGYLLGVPSIAVSLANHNAQHFDTAARVVVELVQRIQAQPPTEPMLLNVNVPDRARADLGGIRVAVITLRQQCLDPMQLEVFDPDILATARTLCVKSRGHFRAGFDQFTTPENVIEVDNPGLTSPNLANFDWTKLPRPVYPLDEDATWTVPNA